MQSVLRAGGIPVLLRKSRMKKPPKRFWIVWTVSPLCRRRRCSAVAIWLKKRCPPAERTTRSAIFEALLIIPMAIARNMPIFGICRGIQVLNVAMGGTLIQDIESQQNIPKKTHQQEPPFSQPVHTVRFEKGSVFERITGATEIKANSMHHQAIKKPADGLQVDGRAEDGIIEAMSAKDGSRIFAVQFHPEYLSDHDAHAQRLFDHFVKLSR
ncbi:MAG: gamma-glutamyl-gamma-aminobutyrate hydrolase family protein, partial [Christensenellales bacterium]